MKFKLDFDELDDVSKTMTNDGEIIENEINKVIEQDITKLRRIWPGIDGKAFCDNLECYFRNMKSIPTTLKDMSNFTKKASGAFRETEDQFTQKYKKEAANYEEPSDNN